jgi:short-subunit dehydrogenase
MASKLLHPAATGALLFALTAAPTQYREPLLAHLTRYLSAGNVERLITGLKWLVSLGVVAKVNGWLSELAQNNFRLRSEQHRYDWDKEIAVITGATGGFGSLMSKDLASRGVTVMALDIRDEMPADMKGNPKIHYFKCDVTDREAIAEVGRQIRDRFGEPSVLINNAGVSLEGTILSQTPENLRKIFDINLISHYFTSQEFLPAMIKHKKGHIVTIASMAAFVTSPGLVPYSNTKVAAWSFHEGLQQETRCFYNAPEVKFSCIHPTFAATPMVAPHQKELEAGGATIITAESVSDAVVKQIMSCRGRQVIIAGNVGAAVWFRALPVWISMAIMQSTDGRMRVSFGTALIVSINH